MDLSDRTNGVPAPDLEKLEEESFMDTKTYLSQIGWYDELIWSKTEERKELEIVTYGVSATPIREKVQNSIKKDMTGDVATEIIIKKEKIDQSINEYINRRSKIRNQIDNIKDVNAHKTLILKYVKQLKIDEIAKEMDYSKPQVMRFLKKGLLEFEKQFGQEYLKNCS